MTGFVYCFECISDCKVKGKKYIGSTKNLRQRYHKHLIDFKEHTHHNPELMKWYNKNDIKFKFYIIEKVDNINNLLNREQLYINKYIDNCFNIVDVNGEFLKKPKKTPLKELKLHPKRSNKQQRAIKKWIKSCKYISCFA